MSAGDEKVLIKICGVTNRADAAACVEAGADMLGFNFYERSPRFVDSTAAVELAGSLPDGVARVGVFVNKPVEDVCEIADLLELNIVQLHGDEPPDYFHELRKCLPATCEVMKAFRVGDDFDPVSISRFDVDAVLLDAWHPTAYGGTGKSIDPTTARAARAYNHRVFLAGGLTPENVEVAIGIARPHAVDVCGGVESAPGRKCAERVAAFVGAVRRAEEVSG